MKIIAVIPAYNEADSILQVVKEVKPMVAEVVVVDDGSTDSTGAYAKQAGATILSHLINRGQGAALNTGTEYALKNSADIIVHFDADGQFVAADIERMVAPIMTGACDVTIGNRFAEITNRIPRIKGMIIFPLARLFNRLILGLDYIDPQNGFRAMNKFTAKGVQIKQDGMAHCTEILIAVKRSHVRVKQIPVTVIYHEYGQTFGGGLRIIKDLFWGGMSK
jgi:glycosyltransferase involved in cell wall biosynthesis